MTPRPRMFVDDLLRDAHDGLRTLARNRGFTAAALITVALGIAANAGIFTLLDQVLIRPLTVREPDRLVQLVWEGNQAGVTYGGGALVSYPLCRELEEQTQVFDGVLCRYPTEVNVSTGRDQEVARAEVVSGSYFTVLGLRPHAGRLIASSDDRQPGMHPVVVLSYDYWMTKFGGAPGIVGSRVLINSYPMTVIGVAPAAFRGIDIGTSMAMWIPAMMKRQVTLEWDNLFSRRTLWIHAVGRLRPGVTPDQARVRLQPWFTSVLQAESRSEEFPPVSAVQRQSFLASRLDVIAASRGVSLFRDRLERPLRVLMAGAMLLLLLASLNLAGLLLARGITRQREVATRMALGASRGRVVRQLLIESLLIAIGGGAIGLLAAPLVSRALRSFIPAGANVTAGIDARVPLFSLAAMILTGAICGLAPLLQMRRVPLGTALTERSPAAGRGNVLARKLLICGQMAFTLVLLVAAGLFVQTLARLLTKGPGFSTANLMMFSLDPTAVGYTAAQAEQAMREVLRRLQERPEIERAAVASTQILNGGRAGGNLTIAEPARRITDRIVYRLRVAPGFSTRSG